MKRLGLLLLVSAVVGLFLPLQANADNPPWVRVPSPNLPPGRDLLPEPGEYVSPQDWHVQYANGIYIDDIRHRYFTADYPPPLPGVPLIESFNSRLDFTAVVPGYGSIPGYAVNVPVTVRVDWASESAGITWYNNEMTQLDVAWASPLGTVLIRESPTLVSDGQTGIDPDGGEFLIQSFFDVFTELSLDGGQSWVPSTNPNGDQVNFIPEPAALALLAVGSLMLIRRRS